MPNEVVLMYQQAQENIWCCRFQGQVEINAFFSSWFYKWASGDKKQLHSGPLNAFVWQSSTSQLGG